MASKIKNKDDKALFTQRLLAFIIDVFLVTLVASTVVTPFVDSEKNNKYSEEAQVVMEKFINQEITIEEYSSQYTVLSYKIARNNGLLSIVTILLNVLYFIVFQIYYNGQTLGKKLLKIRIISNDGELSMNQMIFRSLLANFILLDIITFMFMLFSSKYIYFYGVGIFEFIQYLLVFISVIMVMFRKDGRAIHDLVAHTKVVRV